MMVNILTNPIKLIDVNQLDEAELKNQQILGLMTRALKFRNIKEQTLDYLKDLFIDLNLLLQNNKDANILKVREYIQTSITYLTRTRLKRDTELKIQRLNKIFG